MDKTEIEKVPFKERSGIFFGNFYKSTRGLTERNCNEKNILYIYNGCTSNFFDNIPGHNDSCGAFFAVAFERITQGNISGTSSLSDSHPSTGGLLAFDMLTDHFVK